MESIATSLITLSGFQFDRSSVLHSLCSHLEKWYLKLKESKFDQIDEHYLRNLFGINESLFFKDLNDREFGGTITGVSKQGKLAVKTDDNSISYFEVKELKFML